MQSRSTDGDGKDRITTLQQQVDTLEEELKALRQRRAPETTPPPPPPPAPPPPHPQPAIPRSPTPTRSTPLPTAPMEKTIAPPRRPAAQEGGYEMRRGTPPPPPPPHRDDTDDFVVSDPTLLHSPSRPGGMPSEGEHHDVAALKAQIREVHASFAALKEDNMRLAREYRLLLEKKGEGQDVHSDAKYVQLAEAVREVDRKVSAQQEMHGTMVGVMSRFEDLQRKTGQLLKENAELREMLTTRGQELTEALRRVQAAETRAMSAVEAKEKAILALEEAERDHGTRDTQYAAMQERTREAEGRNQALKHKALVMTQQVALWQQRLQSSTCLPRTHRHTFLTDGLEQLAQTAHELFTLITGDSPPSPPPQAVDISPPTPPPRPRHSSLPLPRPDSVFDTLRLTSPPRGSDRPADRRRDPTLGLPNEPVAPLSRIEAIRSSRMQGGGAKPDRSGILAHLPPSRQWIMDPSCGIGGHLTSPRRRRQPSDTVM